MRKAQQNLLGQQKAEGYWVGELLVDSSLVSDVVAFMHWRGERSISTSNRSACATCWNAKCRTAAGTPTPADPANSTLP